jgi:hypothetical protein
MLYVLVIQHLTYAYCAWQDHSNYTPWVKQYMLAEINHVEPRRTLVHQLAERGVTASQVEEVLFRYASIDRERVLSSANTATLIGTIADPFEMSSQTLLQSLVPVLALPVSQAISRTSIVNGTADTSILRPQQRSWPNLADRGNDSVRSRRQWTISVTAASGLSKHRVIWLVIVWRSQD